MGKSVIAIGFFAIGMLGGVYVGTQISRRSDEAESIDYLVKEGQEGIYGFKIKMRSERVFSIELPNPLYSAAGKTLDTGIKLMEGFEKDKHPGQSITGRVR